MRLALILIAVLLLSTFAIAQTTWYVPDDFPAGIQAALSDSMVTSGDTIIVRPGTYVENIDFVGKAIAVKSEQGASVTTIDGNQAGSVVTFKSGEGLDSLIEGFTITNGTGTVDPDGYPSGGGIYCLNSSPTICKNVITNNSVSGSSWSFGGGIECYDSSPTITGNTLSQNSAGFQGGAIWCRNCSSYIFNNTLSDNSAATFGGGISQWTSATTIVNNIFFGNSAQNGGGIWIGTDSSTYFICNILARNTAIGQYGGGAIGVLQVPSAQTTTAVLNNNTIVGNSVSGPNGDGGGIYCGGKAATIITNTIIWSNDSTGGHEVSVEAYAGNSASLTIGFSDLEDGQSSCYVESGCTLEWGDGMIDTDPLFVDPTNDDYHISWNSPCRNTGDNLAEGISYEDYEGDCRIFHCFVDMGADEFHPHLYHTGDIIPGNPIALKVVGYPTAPVTLYLGSALADPPYSTQHGEFFLNWPPVWQGNLGAVPGNGVLVFNVSIPTGWTSGSEYPLQALVGQWGKPWTWLTNAEVLVVE